jgi:hypothetical protein
MSGDFFDLDLSKNDLSGRLPPEIGLLSSLSEYHIDMKRTTMYLTL